MGSRISGLIGSIVMFSFGAISFYRFYTTGIIFFLLMVFRDVLASWFLMTRNEKFNEKASKKIAVISYVSSAIPVFYFKGTSNSQILIIMSSVISIIGFLLSTLALVELGKSFGVSPAYRGRISTGVYRFTNHPMYVGYFVSESAMIVVSLKNIWIFFLSISFYFYRSVIEDRLLRPKKYF